MAGFEFEFVDELPRRERPKNGERCDPALICDFAAALKANPGKWAKWPAEIQPQTVSTYRKRIKDGDMPAFRGGYAAEGRNNTLYVRYIGEEATDDRT